MFRPIVSMLCAIAFPLAASADPTGLYRVSGVAPGAAYEGTVKVSRLDEKYEVIWSIGEKEIRGVALGGAFYQGSFMIGPAHPADLMLAIGFSDGATFGTITMFLQSDGSFEGFRVASESAKAGQERWDPID